ncbi:MAG: molybdopterin-dependent oxidoreductase [Firmicutes bacterium]|nr:molybdopterin-dependent oxidoreductase [Bacillota bacterium]
MRKTTCPFDCWDACGALAEVGGGGAVPLDGDVTTYREVILRGDPDHPFSRGTICGKLARYPAFLRSDARLRNPLLRDGSNWREISWDDALDLCARKLEQAVRSGPERILFDLGNANCGILRFSGQRLFRLLGATVTTGSLCDIAGEKGLVRTTGACLSHPPADVLNSRAVVLWGRNPAATNTHFWRFVQEARRRGAQVAVVDVYPSATARRADLFLCIRPGTDVHLALGVSRALCDLGLVDEHFLDSHTRGADDFMRLVSSLTVEEAARACGLGAEEVRQLGVLLSLKPASIWLGMGMQHYRWGPTAASFVAALGALTGQYGIPGGGVSFFTASLTPFQLDWADPPPLRGIASGHRTVRKPALAADLLAGPPHRVAWFQASNIVKQAPDSGAIARALARVEFKVAVEVRMSETAQLCDLVLPAASFLEFENVRGSYGTPWVGHMPALVPPPPACRPEPEIYADLARRLGCEGEYLAEGGPDGWLRRALAPLQRYGVTLESLRQQGGAIVADGEGHLGQVYPQLPFAGGVFPTADGRFHFPGPEDFRRYLDLRRQWEGEGDTAHYPLHLITPKSPDRINSHAHARSPDHVCGTADDGAGDGPLPRARIHPSHLPGGKTEALLATPLGRVRVRLVPDPEMKPGVVVIDQGGRVPGMIGINALVPAGVSEDGEGACYYEARCRLER